MAVSTKIIKGRIRSIENTKKITKAMELVSGAKMRKAVAKTLASRAYADEAWGIVRRLATLTNPEHHRFLEKREPVKRVAVVTVSGNRGLCGSFNANVATEALQVNGKAPTVDYFTIGKKARDIIRRAGATLTADFEKPDVTTSVAEVSALAHAINDAYKNRVYDRVYVAYTNFESSLKQTARLKLLLPASITPDAHLGVVTKEDPVAVAENGTEYAYEPSPDRVLSSLLPRLIELQIYQAVLESDASEHSARMLAMRNATDAAGDMIDELTLTFNQARQASITREIAEISGGKAALE